MKPRERAARAHRDADDELDSFIAERIDWLIERGMNPSDARAEALRRLGGTSIDDVRVALQQSAERREERMQASERLEQLRHDVRFALRRMASDKTFTVFAALIVALGVAATTAVFSVLSPLMLRPLPFREPERLVWISSAKPGDGGGLSGSTSRTSNLRDYRKLAKSFSAITGYFAFFEYESYNIAGDGTPERLVGVGVAQDFLRVLGVQPQLGRNFVVDEGAWGAPPAMILTHRFWQRRFNGDPHIVGRVVTLNGKPTTIVGVLPPTFDFASTFSPASRVDFLKPFPIADETDRWGNTLAIIGRLRPGVTVQAAQAELDVINTQLKQADEARWGLRAFATGLQAHITGGLRSALLLLAAGAGLVLVVACANLSNLLLARAQRRGREMAVRSALGAGRGRLVRQLLVESLALAAAGGVVGVLLAIVITRWVANTNAVQIPLLGSVVVDARAAAFTVAVTLLTGFVVGIVPALQVSRGGEAIALRDAGRSASDGRGRTQTREILVILEMAVACLLLVGGGLLLRSFVRVLHVDLGFRPDGAIAWQLNPGRELTDSSRVAYYADITSRVAGVPGVQSVGLTDTPPLGRNRAWGITAEGEPGRPNNESYTVFPRIVDARYLSTMGIPLVAGRQFTDADGPTSAKVVILNRTAASTLFPGKDAIGRNVVLYGNTPVRVVGVVGDVRHQALEDGAGFEMYLPLAQNGSFDALVMVVRSSLPATSIAGSVTAAVHAADPAIPAGDWQPLGAVVDRALSPRRFILSILVAFAGTALVLAALGTYAVLSYMVSQRVREIGIRMALGESAEQVQRRVVVRTLTLAATGVAFGTAGALLSARLIGSLLYGVGATDVPTFLGTAVLLLGAAGVAGYLPARRASGTDPIAAMRVA